jgi:hypothetical protein
MPERTALNIIVFSDQNPGCRCRLQKITVAEIVNKFLTFYVTQCSILRVYKITLILLILSQMCAVLGVSRSVLTF